MIGDRPIAAFVCCCSAVNFDEARFTAQLQQAAEYEARLKQLLQQKGVAAPAIPHPQELGWTGQLRAAASLSCTAGEDIWWTPAPCHTASSVSCWASVNVSCTLGCYAVHTDLHALHGMHAAAPGAC
eukprot:GHUV01011213.1.p3 GENE.GHUV01011213.1~~GHUV01011213.1.p3  ORF type:complete len:127 (-),score=39.52 GHUV01011213.1:2374-2754(-)